MNNWRGRPGMSGRLSRILWEEKMDRYDEDEQALPLSEIFTLLTDREIEEELGEPLMEIAPEKKIVFRNGKKVKKWVCPNVKKGKKQVTFQAVYVDGRDKPKCVKMSAADQKKLSKSAKKAAKKRKAGNKAAARKRARTLRKRKSAGV